MTSWLERYCEDLIGARGLAHRSGSMSQGQGKRMTPDKSCGVTRRNDSGYKGREGDHLDYSDSAVNVHGGRGVIYCFLSSILLLRYYTILLLLLAHSILPRIWVVAISIYPTHSNTATITTTLCRYPYHPWQPRLRQVNAISKPAIKSWLIYPNSNPVVRQFLQIANYNSSSQVLHQLQLAETKTKWETNVIMIDHLFLYRL